jgi:hypothetical protein
MEGQDMTQPIPQTSTDASWRLFIRRHWAVFAAFIAVGILAVAGAVYVFVWFTANAQSSGLVPATLNLWTMNNLVMFILNAIMWELVIIGIPSAIGAIIGWQWWKRIPEQEKQQYNLSTKSSHKGGAGGAISPLLFIAFAIKVYVDGNWNTAMASWNLDYVVGSMVTILIWTAAIFAVPAVIGVIWWIHHETNKP